MSIGMCADCGGLIGEDDGPPDGWQLRDGRTVCQACCVKDLRQIARNYYEYGLRDGLEEIIFSSQWHENEECDHDDPD